MEIADVPKRETPLSKEILEDPTHSVVKTLLSCYSYEGFVYRVLNLATRVADTSKLKTMGPIAAGLSFIISGKLTVDQNFILIFFFRSDEKPKRFGSLEFKYEGFF